MPIDDTTVLAAPASDEAAFSALAAFGPELFAAFGLPPTW
jgi:hypothetical protein